METVSRTSKSPNRSAEHLLFEAGEEVEMSNDEEVPLDCVHSFD